MTPLSGLGLGAVLVLAALLGPSVWRLSTAAELARRSEPYRQAPAQAAMRLLVVGDSTAVGTGASAPERSVVGLIGRSHPRLRIDNRARDGALLADVAEQLAAVPAPADGAAADRPGYDLVLVMAGGNDVIRLHDLQASRADLARVLALARERAPTVLLMPAGNVGNAPFFFPPLSGWMTRRARTLHGHVQALAAREGVVFVDLFRERADDPFVQRPGLHAADGLHPSDAGYAEWLAALQRQADLDRRLAPAR